MGNYKLKSKVLRPIFFFLSTSCGKNPHVIQYIMIPKDQISAFKGS